MFTRQATLGGVGFTQRSTLPRVLLSINQSSVVFLCFSSAYPFPFGQIYFLAVKKKKEIMGNASR